MPTTNAYWRWAVGMTALVLLCAAVGARGQEKKEWTWTDWDHKTRTEAELYKILDDHELWVKSDRKQGKRADLSRADLSAAHLDFGNLSDADLQGADLVGANLTGADLTGADLDRGSLYYADLNGSIFEPKSLPKIDSIAQATHMELLSYDRNSGPLTQLRKQFQRWRFSICGKGDHVRVESRSGRSGMGRSSVGLRKSPLTGRVSTD